MKCNFKITRTARIFVQLLISIHFRIASFCDRGENKKEIGLKVGSLVVRPSILVQ